MTKTFNGRADGALRDLLVRTSRTFALAIPLLPEPTRTTVSLAYLLFRGADCLEDAPNWTRDERLHSLTEFADLMLAPNAERANIASSAWLQSTPALDGACLELLAASADLVKKLEQLEPDVQNLVCTHVRRTALGMCRTLMLAEPSGRLHLRRVSDLRAYCYVVAGIVGELLSALFVRDAPRLASVQPELAEHQAAFGEGLQLVNILKDERADALEGRIYLPADVPRRDVIALAREDLRHARLYIEALRRGGAPAGFIAFCSLPAELAEAALLRIEHLGPGAKVSRAEVAAIMKHIQSSPSSDHSASAQGGK